MTWTEWAGAQLDAVRAAGQWRVNRSFDSFGPEGLLDNRSVLSFASNDYLGLSTHPQVRAAAHAAIDRWGTGATASRLIVGSRPVHDELEAALADWKGVARALVFPSGFAANLGVLSTFGGPDTVVFSDELNHASIIDGCRLSRSKVQVYRHNDVEHLCDLMQAASPSQRRIVVTDSVFSMDGDVAPIHGLAAVCTENSALLVLDEAHAVLGPHELPAVDGLEVLRVGTLSKTLGALGGFVAGATPYIELLINRSRPFVFTTALSPPDAAAALAALQVLRSAEGAALVRRLRSNIDQLSPGHPSPIIPIVVGAEADTVAVAAELLARGIFIPAIRPPTVPPGTSRLRVALSAAHTPDQIRCLRTELNSLGLLIDERST